MSTIALYNALVKAGVPENDAKEAVTDFPNDTRIDDFGGKIDRSEAKIDDVAARLSRVETKVDDLDDRMSRLETRVDRIDGKIERLQSDLTQMRADVSMLKWGMGVIFAMQTAILVRLFTA